MSDGQFSQWCHHCSQPFCGRHSVCPYCNGRSVQDIHQLFGPNGVSASALGPSHSPGFGIAESISNLVRRVGSGRAPPRPFLMVPGRQPHGHSFHGTTLPGMYPGMVYIVNDGPGQAVGPHTGHHNFHLHDDHEMNQRRNDSINEAELFEIVQQINASDNADSSWSPLDRNDAPSRGDHGTNQTRDDSTGEETDLYQLVQQISMTDTAARPQGPAPAPRSAINALPTFKVTRRHLSTDAKCPVCQDDFVLGSKAKKMPCNHIYHSNCIVTWLSEHDSCPVCRTPLSSNSSTSVRSGRNPRRRNHGSRRSGWNPLSCLRSS